MTERFYVTTPIYYVNDIPHIGHAYTTIAADILARRNRLLNKEVFFLTGTDEHGQKVEKAAFEKGRTSKEHADMMVWNFKKLWKRLNISNNAFIRTTDKEHIKIVQGILQALLNRGDIKKMSYSGWYCTPDERFWTEKEVVNGNCPDCGRTVDHIEEENYFFLMSKYQERLISYIEGNPSYILPETRRNEVLGFLRNNELGDLCISRPKQRLSWGIPLPFDQNFVTYVWFDALVNYYSATKYLAPNSSESIVTSKQDSKDSSLVTRHSSLNWWPASHHLVGKDILTTHAVYWSTMLMALDMPLPGNIFAHGWWTVEGKKMSKSIGNVVDPNAMVERYGVDAFRYFLFREVTFGLDGDFSEQALVNRTNTDLANDLGNLLSRFLTMAEKYCCGFISSPASETSLHSILTEHRNESVSSANQAMDAGLWSHLRFNLILEHIWNMVRAANNLIARTEPWKLARSDADALMAVLFHIHCSLRLIAALVYPFMPDTAERMWLQIGLKSLKDEAMNDRSVFGWDWSPDYEIRVSKGEQLFPRIETTIKTLHDKDKKEKKAMGEETEAGLVGIDDFTKIELKVAKVISAECVERSDKLIKLKVDAGGQRQIVAGIGKSYSPEDLVGKKIVIVANLKPAKLMGVESQGMLLAATDRDGACSILIPEKDVKEGSRVK